MAATQAAGKRVQIQRADLAGIAASVERFRIAKGWSWPDYVRFVDEIARRDLNMAPGLLYSEKVLAFIRRDAEAATPPAVNPAAPSPVIYSRWVPEAEG